MERRGGKTTKKQKTTWLLFCLQCNSKTLDKSAPPPPLRISFFNTADFCDWLTLCERRAGRRSGEDKAPAVCKQADSRLHDFSLLLSPYRPTFHLRPVEMQKIPPPLSVTRRHFSDAEELDSPTAAGTAETVAGAPIFSQLLHLNAARRLRDERVRAGLLAFDVIIAGWGLLWVFARRDASGKLFFFLFFFLGCLPRHVSKPAHEDHPADQPRLSGCARPLGTCSTCFQPPPPNFLFFIFHVLFSLVSPSL